RLHVVLRWRPSTSPVRRVGAESPTRNRQSRPEQSPPRRAEDCRCGGRRPSALRIWSVHTLETSYRIGGLLVAVSATLDTCPQSALEDNLLHADGASIDHLAVDRNGAHTLGLRLGIFSHHGSCFAHSFGVGGVDVQRDVDLNRMKRPFADEAKQLRANAFLSIGFGILKAGERPINRVHASRSCRDRQLPTAIVPRIAGIAALTI